MKQRMQRFMAGRYGADQLGQLYLGVSMVLLVVSLFSRWNIFYAFALALMGYEYYRMLSRQVEKRYQGDESKKDIHEQNIDYLHRCYQAGQEVFSATGAVMIECVRNGKMLPPEAIHEMIYNHIKQVIDG